MRGRVAVAGTVLLGLLAGCGGGGDPSGGGTAGVPSATSTGPAAKGGPLTDLPECSAPPEAVDAEAAGELVLPDGTLVTGVEDLDALVSVRAYVGLTPIGVRRFYGSVPELELYALEDEVYEAEILYGTEDRRVFVRAQAQCSQGSVLSIFIGPEDGEGLPALGGN